MSFRYRGAAYHASGHSADSSDARPTRIYRGAPVPDDGEAIATFPPRFVARLIYRGVSYLRLR